MSYLFTLVNPPPGFSISNDGDILVDANAPVFNGFLNVHCTNGINATSASINFNWLLPTKSALFSETGELVVTSKSSAALEVFEQLTNLLKSISVTSIELEALNVALLTLNSVSIASIGDIQITTPGLEWEYFLWSANYGSLVTDYAMAKKLEVYHPIGLVGSPTEFAAIVCVIPTLRDALLASVHSFFNDTSWTYEDCLDGHPGDSSMQATTPYSAIYYFERP